MHMFMPFQSLSADDMNTEMMKNFDSAGYTLETFLNHKQPQVSYHPAVFTHNSLSSCSYGNDPCAAADDLCQSKKRKAIGKSSISSEFPGNTSTENKNNSERVKSRRRTEKDEKKFSEIVHVRACRGQATDNHSLAERLRRENINKKIRRLQELVPGCNKEMGMAATLEEIINYVHSLQNQVEFLSMEIAAAFSSHVQNAEAEPIKEAQETKAHEEEEMEKWGRDRNGEEQQVCFNTTWPF